jgi:uncharacterized protein
MKFVCDQMLTRLGRWLRAAGYDTLIVDRPMHDREIMALAAEEGRLLITRDRHFIEMNVHKDLVIWLRANLLEDCIHQLSQRLPIDWLKAPFSRCLICNQPLVDAAASALEEIPQEVRQRFDHFWWCPSCKKTYWLGSHTTNMLKSLRAWKEEETRKKAEG